MLDWLLAEDAEGFPPAPPEVLANWVETIPYSVYRVRGRRALKQHFGLNPAPALPRGSDRFDAWLNAPFQPPVYSTDDETGERMLLSPDFVEKTGLLETKPQKYYRVPSGLTREEMGKWIRGEPPYDDQEPYAVWSDWEGTRVRNR
ncbi:hypothetical protein ACFQS7_29330 [Dankookia sp. GCM10030260]|uniref:hypothetical protein n=1 Tax=Dankookia sp. GCM10030260 TaxID=3273390 RepID=UPI003620340F